MRKTPASPGSVGRRKASAAWALQAARRLSFFVRTGFDPRCERSWARLEQHWRIALQLRRHARHVRGTR